jgi:hypothetical protein
MLNETFATIFFRLLNFIAFIGLSAFVFKKYFRKTIEESIKQKHLEEINFGNHIRELEQRSKTLSEEIVKQEQLCAYLIDRTTQWQEAFEKQPQEQLEEQKKLTIQAQLRTDKQAEHIRNEGIIKAVVPLVIEQTTKKLEEWYADPKHNKQFVENIVAFMEKSL